MSGWAEPEIKRAKEMMRKRPVYLSSIPEKESRWFRMMPHILHIIQLALRQRCNRGEIGSVAPNLNGKDEMTMGGTMKWVAKK